MFLAIVKEIAVKSVPLLFDLSPLYRHSQHKPHHQFVTEHNQNYDLSHKIIREQCRSYIFKSKSAY